MFELTKKREDEECDAVDEIEKIPAEMKKAYSSLMQVIYELKIQYDCNLKKQ